MIAACSLVLALAVQSDPSKVLFTKSRLDSRDWAEAANYYIGMGEPDACADLIRNAGASKAPKRNVRAALICRILFEGKGKGGLRAPRLGDISLPTMTMPSSAWPEFPLFQQDGVWFELDENYKILGGLPEKAADYIDYCQKNGKFRTDRLSVPSHQQAVDALGALQGSKRWQKIVWSDSSLHDSYTYDRGWTLDLLKAQTQFRD